MKGASTAQFESSTIVRPFWADRLVSGIAWASPLTLLGSLYITWGAAWIMLGHRPRPNLDDPKYISAVVDVPYFITMVLMMVAPGAMVLGLLFAAPRATLLKRALSTLVLAGLWVLVISLLRWDPQGIVSWFMD